jgi:hypothetical protein
LDQPLQRHTDRIGKLGGGEARKQTEAPDNALKKHAALLCWQVADCVAKVAERSALIFSAEPQTSENC